MYLAMVIGCPHITSLSQRIEAKKRNRSYHNEGYWLHLGVAQPKAGSYGSPVNPENGANYSVGHSCLAPKDSIALESSSGAIDWARETSRSNLTNASWVVINTELQQQPCGLWSLFSERVTHEMELERHKKNVHRNSKNCSFFLLCFSAHQQGTILRFLLKLAITPS